MEWDRKTPGFEWRNGRDATAVSQPGQSESARPLHGLHAPFITPAPYGASVDVVGVERVWDTDSIYNNTPAPMTYRALFIHADVALP